jgi:hypothetical protein
VRLRTATCERRQRGRRLESQALLTLARAPEQLLMLDRYRGRIERAVTAADHGGVSTLQATKMRGDTRDR